MKMAGLYRPGGDPSVCAEHQALHEELTKITHTACPNVNWNWVEYQSLRLFAQNGAELYSAAALALARTQLYGLPGLNAGIVLIGNQLSKHRSLFWPSAPAERQQILSWLFFHLQSLLSGQELTPADLYLLNTVRIHLNQLMNILESEGVSPVKELNSLRQQLDILINRLGRVAVADDAIVPAQRTTVEVPTTEGRVLENLGKPVINIAPVEMQEPLTLSLPTLSKPGKPRLVGELWLGVIITLGLIGWAWYSLR